MIGKEKNITRNIWSYKDDQEGFLELPQIQNSLNVFCLKEDLRYVVNNDPQGTLSPKTEQ